MSAIETAQDLMRYYVTPMWVARFYGVSRLEVYRAITSDRLKAVRIRSAGRRVWVLDERLLPPQFPR